MMPENDGWIEIEIESRQTKISVIEFRGKKNTNDFMILGFIFFIYRASELGLSFGCH
jgi:hypothetical protein